MGCDGSGVCWQRALGASKPLISAPQPTTHSRHRVLVLIVQATGDESWEPGKPIYRFDSGSERIEIYLEFN